MPRGLHDEHAEHADHVTAALSAASQRGGAGGGVTPAQVKGARVTSFVHATTSIISLWRSLTFPKVPRTRKPRTRIPNPSWDAGEDAGRCRWHRGPFDGPRAPGPAPPFSTMWPWASLHLLSTLVSHLESGLATVLTTAGQSLGRGWGGGGGRVQSRSARGARGTWETMKVHISSHDGGERKGALGRPRSSVQP